MKSSIFLELTLLLSQLTLAGNSTAVGDGTANGKLEKMTDLGCKALIAKDFPKDKAPTSAVLADFSAGTFLARCEARAKTYMHGSDNVTGLNDKKFTVGLIQQVCLISTPDLYKSSSTWTKNRIGCIKEMLQSSGNDDLSALWNTGLSKSNLRQPASDSETYVSRELMHAVEHQLNLQAY